MSACKDSCDCVNPSIAIMDHIKGYRDEQVSIVNRCCTKCFKHWYGEENNVKSFSKIEWDKWINSAFGEEQ